MARRKSKKSTTNTYLQFAKKAAVAFTVMFIFGSILRAHADRVEPTNAAQIIISNYDKSENRTTEPMPEDAVLQFTAVDETFFQGDINYLNTRMPDYAHTNRIFKRDSIFYIEVVCVFKADAVRLASRKAERRMRCKGK